MTAINYSGAAIQNGISRTEFTYDGFCHRVKIVEKTSTGNIVSTKQHLWVGNTIAEERDANNNVQKRFYYQGVQIGNINYYYTRDHLGSIREVLTSTGAIAARYDYDPCGNVNLVQGNNIADFQYAAYFYHGPSSLNLTKFRAYDSKSARWLSRDPLGEEVGINLYKYASNNCIQFVDILGQDFSTFNDINDAPFHDGQTTCGSWQVDTSFPKALISKNVSAEFERFLPWEKSMIHTYFKRLPSMLSVVVNSIELYTRSAIYHVTGTENYLINYKRKCFVDDCPNSPPREHDYYTQRIETETVDYEEKQVVDRIWVSVAFGTDLPD